MFSAQPLGLTSLLERWQADPGRGACLVAKRELPAREARHVDLPPELDQRLAEALWRRGVPRLYTHQARAFALGRARRDFVVATPTASGKTLCYNLPVFDALLRDERATALYLFPTKALARDQVAEAEALAAATGAELPVAVYDGDTPQAARRLARARARVIATNPDMLHAALLPHHARWARFFAGLRFVVVDEVHAARGLFGSHVANVLRRLARVARFHGGAPSFIGASATIGNPGEHAARLFSRAVEVLDESGAPSGARTFFVYNPPVVDRTLGVRASALDAACALVRELEQAGTATIAFVRTRALVEVLVRALGDAGVTGVRGYRAGYLPSRRREVERDLRAGRAHTVVSTSALELGIDIGSLDASIVVGWPGSRAAFWQRAGRAGRRGAPSMAVLIARGEPLDQFVAAEPRWLFDDGVENARTAPDNATVLLAHLQCAAFELPFEDGESFGPLDAAALHEALGLLAREGRVVRADGRWQWASQVFPAAEVPLRGPADENFLIVDEERGAVIAEVDRRDAPRTIHEGAIHGIEGKLHEVRRLDWAGKKAYVRRVEADFYTQAVTYRKVGVLRVEEEAGPASWGEVRVAERVIGFKKLHLRTHENIGYGEVNLPDLDMHTTACWWTARGHGLPGTDAGEGAEGAAYALRHAAALLMMSDAADVGVAIEGVGDDAAAPAPRIFLYDNLPGGSGLADGLYARRGDVVARARAAVDRCACARGCPACAGAGRRKDAAREILKCLDES